MVVGVYPGDELFEVLAGQVGEAGDLGVVPGQPRGEGVQTSVDVAAYAVAVWHGAVEVAFDVLFHLGRCLAQLVLLG
ncbi:hypothetical protein ACQP1G_21600 [Nocardia sp. CA-107356]|uniref:hypothetical protein n=1 Tax=Nocardia sp. CA-107356 TaxID=3239972 RepID=UPI003D949FD1